MERLRSADKMLSSHKGGHAGAHVSESERETRVSEAKDKLRENIERAGKEAADKQAVEYSKNEYRQGILERENKKAEAARRERERALVEERLQRAKLRESEREEYLAREREKNERANEGVLSLLAEFDGKSSVAASKEDATTTITDENADSAAEVISQTDSSSGIDNNSVAADDFSEASTSSDAESSDAERITVSIGSASLSRSPNGVSADENMTLNIGTTGASVSVDDTMTLKIAAESGSSSHTVKDGSLMLNIGSYAPAHYAPPEAYAIGAVPPPGPYTTHSPYAIPRPRVDFSDELRAAEERHFVRRREAVSVASGIYREEIRLLAEEEARYAAEIAEIKARRSEYSDWLSELDGRELVFGDNANVNTQRAAERPDPYAERRASEYEKYNEESLASNKAREEDLIREYDKYVEAMERGGASSAQSRPTGEALPYSSYSPVTEYPSAERGGAHYEETEYAHLADGYRPQSEPYASDFGGYAPIGYGTRRDQSAVREYEAEMAKRDRAVRRNSDQRGRAEEDLAELDQMRLEEAETVSRANNVNGMDVYAKSRLSKKLDKFFKEEAALVKKQKKLTRVQLKASPEENAQLIVEKIAIAKELCEMSADVLGACVYVGAKAKTGKHKRILSDYIEKYNQLCDEYEAQTGRPLDRVDHSMVDDVMAGKLYRPIQNVYYHGMEDDNTYLGLTPEVERDRRLETEDALVAEEYARYVEEGAHPELSASEKRAASKRRSERMGAVKRAAERDVLLISLRTEYRIDALRARRDVLLYSYDVDKKDRQKEIRGIEKSIARVKAAERRAAALERSDNSRYYYLAAVDASEEKVRKGARRERLEALRLRLDVLLSERESINERLIALYGGADSRLKKTRVARKAGNVRRKAAKSMYKRQRDLAKKIDRIKAPLDMKARAIELLNKRIADTAEYESARYTLKTLKPGGRAREELLRTMKRSKKNIAAGEREIKYVIKKLQKHEERYRDDREWAGFLIALAVIAGLCIGAWMLFGDRVLAYFAELRAYFGF